MCQTIADISMDIIVQKMVDDDSRDYIKYDRQMLFILLSILYSITLIEFQS